jgi:hypothetical protein
MQTRSRLSLALAAVCCWTLPLSGQTTARGAGMTPLNDLPNPYQTVENWARMPEGRTWGSTSAVDIDRDGTSIWVA